MTGYMYDKISDEEKKSLIKEIEIFSCDEAELPLKSILFNFPVYKDGSGQHATKKALLFCKQCLGAAPCRCDCRNGACNASSYDHDIKMIGYHACYPPLFQAGRRDPLDKFLLCEEENEEQRNRRHNGRRHQQMPVGSSHIGEKLHGDRQRKQPVGA
ncbi:MAG: hypothetical protein K0R57_2437 [Paenibacillaceae bacterium]|nr:hypothetical protein [Paenibacillaceae bacterium]